MTKHSIAPRHVLILCGSVMAGMSGFAAGCADSHSLSDASVVPGADGGADVGAGTDGGGLPPPRDAGPPGDRAGDVWEGYIEAYAFPSGSDRVRIVFDSAIGDGPRSGVVVFGSGTPPPPASDPSVGYPPGVDWEFGISTPFLWEGLEYPIVRGSVSGARVQVTIETAALWERWCELQTPIPTGDFFGCLPDVGSAGTSGPGWCAYYDATGTLVAVDCGKWVLCSRGPLVCRCDAVGCEAGSVVEVSFDFHVTGNNGDGSASLGVIHLTR